MLRLFTSAWVLARVGLGFVSAAVLVDTAAAETLRAGHSGAGLAILAAGGERYSENHPMVTVSTVLGPGSSGGIKAVLAGKRGAGLSSRAPKPEEEALEARVIGYGRTPLMTAVHAENFLNNITSAQLAAYRSARATARPDSAPARPALSPESDADTSTLKAFPRQVDEPVTLALARPGMIGGAPDEKGADDRANIPRALGTSTWAWIWSKAREIETLPLYGWRRSGAAYPHYKTELSIFGTLPSEGDLDFIQVLKTVSATEILARTVTG